MLAQDGFDLARVEAPVTAAEPRRDPAGLGRQLGLLDVLVTTGTVEEDDGDEPAAGHQPDEEQPPLELGHQQRPPERRIGATPPSLR